MTEEIIQAGEISRNMLTSDRRERADKRRLKA